MSRRTKPVIVLSIEDIAKRANEVVSDVDELVAQLKLIIEERAQ